jgi:hypothetical protein
MTTRMKTTTRMTTRGLRLGLWLGGVLLGVLAMPLAAWASPVTYYFTPGSTGCTGATSASSCSNATNIGALDEHYVYTWRISDASQLKGQNITGLTLTFTDLYNWDNNINGLFVHLLQNANLPGTNNPGYTDNTGTVQGVGPCSAANCVSQYQDVALNENDFTPFDDLTNPSSNSDDSSWVIPSSAGDTFLTTTSFAGQGQNDISSGSATHPDPAPTGALPAGWTATADGTTSCPSADQCTDKLYTYTFTFNNASVLNSFISDDGTFAIGLDADCHYFNNGILLTLQTNGPLSTPEPVSLSLLGTGLLFMARRVSRRRA